MFTYVINFILTALLCAGSGYFISRRHYISAGWWIGMAVMLLAHTIMLDIAMSPTILKALHGG